MIDDTSEVEVVRSDGRVRAADFAPGLIAVPAQEQMWTRSAITIFGGLGKPPGSLMQVDDDGSHSIAAKRNNAIETGLSRPDVEWICFIDSDMVPAPDSLLYLLAAGQDIVSGFCFTRIAPYESTACRRIAEPDPESGCRVQRLLPSVEAPFLVEVDVTGAAMLLVRRRVLEAIDPPWFEHPEPGRGEDEYFCNKATAAGFKIYVHTGVPGHVGIVSVDKEFALRHSV